ncbi:MAG: hypothetical protein AAF573_13490, partial [Bacteroidota bacterium]
MKTPHYFRNIAAILTFLWLVVPNVHYGQSFSSSDLQGTSLTNPTSLQFGPDGRLYASQQDGYIYAYTITRNGADNYQVIDTEIITVINTIQNHDDDGTVHGTQLRQVTGILVTGTAEFPVLYVGSSDYRVGGGQKGDLGLDTNSGVISRLTWDGSVWDKVEIIRGLPRSEENHANNGMQLDEATNVMYVTSGGNTNGGAPSNNFGFITEYALAAAVLAIDLNGLEAMPIHTDQRTGGKFIYDLPTLNDPTRPDIDNSHPDFPYASGHPLYNSTVDLGDPFGGNDGLNQAKWVIGSPVQIFATGFRNIYDLLLTDDGRLYTWDNGANGNWGGHPHQEGGGNATNNWLPGSSKSGAMPAGWIGEDGIIDGDVNNKDGVHFLGYVTDYDPFDPNADPANSYYGGHPCPIRANPAGAGLYTHDSENGGNNGTVGGYWRTAVTGDPTTTLPVDWPPVPLTKANPIEGDFQNAGEDDNSFWAFQGVKSASTNGLALYTSSNANGTKQGHMLAAAHNHTIYEIHLNANGTIDNPGVAFKQNPDVTKFAKEFSTTPLDIIAQGDTDLFPGTVWVISYVSNNITVFEPQDFITCYSPGDPEYDPNADYDSDGYTNDDEIQNEADHCNGASVPPDADDDQISDLLDTDDDNDGVVDTNDYFQLDPDNGLTTNLPIAYPLLNGDPGTGIAGLGFTGLMANGDDYLNLIKDKSNSEIIILYGGAPGQLGIGGPPGDGITTGDAYGTLNSQENAFQFGVNVNSATPPFTVTSGLLGPIFSGSPEDSQSAGIFIGTGDQSNYVKVVANANGGQGGVLVTTETNDNPIDHQYNVPEIISASFITFYLTIDPQNGTVRPGYSVDGGAIVFLGSPINVGGTLLTAIQGTPALAIGVISTSRGSSTQFTASWDFINIDFETVSSFGQWKIVNQNNDPTARHENAYVQAGDKFYLIGGRNSGAKKVDIYDPQTQTWSSGTANHPFDIHHAQAVEYHGLIYIVGAMTGNGNNEALVDKIYIYNPTTDTWYIGGDIPRPRAGGGVVVYNDKIYLLGGLQDGHKGDYVLWFDEYDPETGIWNTMPDMPRFRDHFHAALVGDKLVAAGGRLSDTNGNLSSQGYPSELLPDNIPPVTNTQNVLVSKVDIFDFQTGNWVTTPLPDIPTARAGAAVGVIGNEAIVIGGEIDASKTRKETEAFDVSSYSWRSLANLIPEGTFTGRHGTQAIVNNGGIYVAAGAGTKGGSNELNSQQAFYMFGETTPTGSSLVASDLSIAPSLVDFGQAFGGQSVIRSVALTNENGNQGVEILDVSINGSTDYSIVTSSLPRLVLPGESVNINIEVSPTSQGTITASLLVNHTGANGSLSANLTAEGVINNNPPTVVNPIADISVDMDSTPLDIDLSEVFVDNEDGFLELGLIANSNNPSLVTTSVSSGILTLSFGANATGVASITVRATDTDGAFVEDIFTVNIVDPNISLTQVLYRVNAGGGELSGSPVWGEDGNGDPMPSPYRT